LSGLEQQKDFREKDSFSLIHRMQDGILLKRIPSQSAYGNLDTEGKGILRENYKSFPLKSEADSPSAGLKGRRLHKVQRSAERREIPDEAAKKITP